MLLRGEFHGAHHKRHAPEFQFPIRLGRIAEAKDSHSPRILTALLP
jgi:hypothetical protein